jgi:predicted permease
MNYKFIKNFIIAFFMSSIFLVVGTVVACLLGFLLTRLPVIVGVSILVIFFIGFSLYLSWNMAKESEEDDEL